MWGGERAEPGRLHSYGNPIALGLGRGERGDIAGDTGVGVNGEGMQLSRSVGIPMGILGLWGWAGGARQWGGEGRGDTSWGGTRE